MKLEHTLLVLTATVVLTVLATVAVNQPEPDYCPEVKVAIDGMYNCMADPSCLATPEHYEQLIKNNLYIQGNCTDERKASEVTEESAGSEEAYGGDSLRIGGSGAGGEEVLGVQAQKQPGDESLQDAEA